MLTTLQARRRLYPREAAEEGSEKASQEAPGYPYTGKRTKWPFLSNENKILQSTPTPLFLPLSTSSAEAIAGQEPFGSSREYGSASCGVRSGSHDAGASHHDGSCVRATHPALSPTVLGYYTNELRHRGYDKAICVLPHDGVNTNMVTGLRYADHLRDAEFTVEVIPNQGAGAAAMRIEAVRRIFPKVLVQRGDHGSRQGRVGVLSCEEGRGPRRGPGARARLVEPCCGCVWLDGDRVQGAERLCPLQSSA